MICKRCVVLYNRNIAAGFKVNRCTNYFESEALLQGDLSKLPRDFVLTGEQDASIQTG
jgi:hypothetical protein